MQFKFLHLSNHTLIFICIIAFSFLTKVWNLGYPDTYVFDEVYVGFTAEEFAKNNPQAWVWDYPSPKGFAYCWSHPQFGKLLMSVPIKLFGINSFTRRIVALLAGVGLSIAAYYLGKQIFPKRPNLWLLAAGIVSLDGLVFTLSRIGLADTILCLFLMLAFLFLLKKRYVPSAIFWGLALSIKWSAVYFLPVMGLIVLSYYVWKKNLLLLFKNLLSTSAICLLYLVIGAGMYLLSYAPFFWYGYTWSKFIELQKQMYWYHTGLVATHPHQSPAISWPVDYRPVWFWVDYQKDTTANIYALGNPFIFWFGLVAVFFTFGYAWSTKKKPYFYLLLIYFMFWVPWTASPRIMFLYHYLPAVPYLCIMLAFMLDTFGKLHKKLNWVPIAFMSLFFITFWFFYPYWTGIPIPNDKVYLFRWLKTWQ